MHELYPGYDVLAKRDTLSWNDKTREVIAERLALDAKAPRFFDAQEYQTLRALCDCICPQKTRRVPVEALVDEKMRLNLTDGFRQASMPEMRTAWRLGLAALDSSSVRLHGEAFSDCAESVRVELLRKLERGALNDEDWRGMAQTSFFHTRVLPDVVKSYYAFPAAWSEIGFGGPASPRGYVRMDANMRDPWEAAEARPGAEASARKENRRVAR